VDPRSAGVDELAEGPPFSDSSNLRSSLVLAPDGQILVADPEAFGKGAIIRVNPGTGNRNVVASGAPFGRPTGLALSPDGTLLVAGSGGHFITRIERSGTRTIVADGIGSPQGLALLSSDVLLVSGFNPASVRLIDLRFGGTSTIASGPPLDLPTGIATAADGSILVADRVARSVFRLESGRKVAVASGGLLQSPNGIAIAPNGVIFVADPEAAGQVVGSSGAILRIDPRTGSVTALATGPVPTEPTGIAIEPPVCDSRPATIVGSTGRDKLRGSRFSDVIAGLGGKDSIKGAKGNDLICGGHGTDRIAGGKGDDRVLGGPGDDRVSGGRGRDRVVD
jgi:Ca2+-binding RTX toxin-like protein